MTTSSIDPTTLAVVRGYLDEVVDEMDLVQVRAAFSPIVSDMKDRANGIFHAATGETVAQGHLGSPIFITTMQHAVQAVVAWLTATQQAWEPGDAYLLNDPYLGGTHLQDAKLVAPFFWDGEPLLLLANTGHWMDTGAAQPGAFSPACRTIFEEGLRLPVIRLVRAGVMEPEVLELIRVNNRLPDLQEGDLRSQHNALLIGQRRLTRLFERYGAQVVQDCLAEFDSRSQQQMESKIRAIPDGTYRASDVFDNDGITNRPIPVEVAITVDAAHMTIDFTGTAPMSEGPMNLTRPTTVTACYTALKHLFPDIPINAGCFRPVSVQVPEGSLLAPIAPQAVGGYSEIAARLVGLVIEALGQSQPEMAAGRCFETGGVVVVSGDLGEEVWVLTFPYGGGYGASLGSNGLVNGTSVIGMANFPSLEIMEQDYPVHWNRFGINPDSGGAGEWAGGCGNEYDFTVETDATLSILGDQSISPPRGVLGGGPGGPNEVAYTVAGEWIAPEMGSKVPLRQMRAGDRVRLHSPGGGGYGDSARREREAIQRDVQHGYLTAETALERYELPDRLSPAPNDEVSA
ncbi:MAG: N-methylhydantoinase [Acidimicrobiaceae bacterium]|jgi:N-methylhydantoinase B